MDNKQKKKESFYPENVHEGRRKRMIQKLKDMGPAAFQTHEILEILLYNTYSRADTNVIAHDLLSVFGGVKNLFAASHEAISAVRGVGDNATNFIKLLGELYKRALCEDYLNLKLTNIEQTISYLHSLFALENVEKLYVICADSKYKVIATICMGEGDSESTTFNPDDVIKKALLVGAKYIILTHNHLVGSVKPSTADFLSTKALITKISASDILVLDHIVIYKDEQCSFKENGLIDLIYNGIEGNQKEMIKDKKLPISKGGTLLDDEFTMYLYNSLKRI